LLALVAEKVGSMASRVLSYEVGKMGHPLASLLLSKEVHVDQPYFGKGLNLFASGWKKALQWRG
jgi:hypothetical protein